MALDTFKPLFQRQPVTPNDSSLATALAGPYAIERELGRGGMAAPLRGNPRFQRLVNGS